MDDGIVIGDSLHQYFRDAIDEAADLQEMRTTPEVIDYLVRVLVDYSAAPANTLDQPLALMMAQSDFEPPKRRFVRLKRVGDQALYMVGFFRERLSRGAVDIEYYNTVGGVAYARLAKMLHDASKQSDADVYGELAHRFPDYVDVLGGVSVASSGEHDIGALYERWLTSSEKAVEHKLRELGVATHTKRGNNN